MLKLTNFTGGEFPTQVGLNGAVDAAAGLTDAEREAVRRYLWEHTDLGAHRFWLRIEQGTDFYFIDAVELRLGGVAHAMQKGPVPQPLSPGSSFWYVDLPAPSGSAPFDPQHSYGFHVRARPYTLDIPPANDPVITVGAGEEYDLPVRWLVVVGPRVTGRISTRRMGVIAGVRRPATSTSANMRLVRTFSVSTVGAGGLMLAAQVVLAPEPLEAIYADLPLDAGVLTLVGEHWRIQLHNYSDHDVEVDTVKLPPPGGTATGEADPLRWTLVVNDDLPVQIPPGGRIEIEMKRRTPDPTAHTLLTFGTSLGAVQVHVRDETV